MKSLLYRITEKYMPEPNSGCWIWIGCLNNQGYGQIHFKGKTELAHRITFALIKGYSPKLQLCHICDNRLCINPDHLFEGTQKDNQRDASRKGRMFKPYGNKRRLGKKFTEEQKLKISIATKIGMAKWKADKSKTEKYIEFLKVKLNHEII